MLWYQSWYLLDALPGQPVHTISWFKTELTKSVTVVLQFCNALQANILKTLQVVCNCTVTRVTPGSINVENTISFSGGNGAAAKAAQSDLVTLLKSDAGIISVFGTTYGTVSVSGVEAVEASNSSKLLS